MNRYGFDDLEKMVEFFGLKDKNVLVHSSLFALGVLKNVPLSSIADSILDFFEKKFNSLYFPANNHGFPETRFMDLTKVNSKTGLLSNVALQRGYERTIHPIFSYCGNDTKIVQPQRVEQNPFDENSFFDRLRKIDGQILIFGALPREATYIIYTEFMNRVKYRYLKPFKGNVITKYGKVDDVFYHFAFPRSEDIKHNYDNFHKMLIEEGKTKTFLLGDKKVYLIDMNIFLEEVTKFLDKNPYGLVNKTPKYWYQFKDGREQVVEKIIETKESLRFKSLFKRLFPINRSITGDGFRKSLDIIGEYIPIKKLEFSTGMKCFDWEVPKEWSINDAWIKDSKGNVLVDFKKNNLHILGYSEPIHKKISKEELLKHIFTLPDLPNAIPYRTSYYEKRWGFCIEYERLKDFSDEEYEVFIDSRLFEGYLTIGECYIKGKSDKEILLSTYMCHPSMANNELSGPVTLTFLAKELLERDNFYSYRILFLPETIGSIVYLSRYYKELQKRVIAGFVIAQIGLNRDLVFKKTRDEHFFVNETIENILQFSKYKYKLKEFSPNGGGDQRQYCSLGINLPVVYISRVFKEDYKEYHTSLDTIDIIDFAKMKENIEILIDLINGLELNKKYINLFPFCEPKLGDRGLYPTLSGEKANKELEMIKYILGFSDGKTYLHTIANKSKNTVLEYKEVVDKLIKKGLISENHS